MIQDRPVISVQAKSSSTSKQNITNIEGISASSAGATGLCMFLAVIPPSGKSIPHYHNRYETALYIVRGRVETRYGAQLEHSKTNEAGDFLFVPPNVPHQTVNLSDTEEVLLVVTRNDPNEQESVVLYETGSTGQKI
jgi:uncharacterized RmlC-like cupin family protein